MTDWLVEERARVACRECAEQAAEIERLREERDLALAVFSKFTHKGPLNLPREFHVERGRKMAGLRVTPGPGTTTPAGGEGAAGRVVGGWDGHQGDSTR